MHHEMHHTMRFTLKCTVCITGLKNAPFDAVQATILALLDELFSELSGPSQTEPQVSQASGGRATSTRQGHDDPLMRRLVYRGCE